MRQRGRRDPMRQTPPTPPTPPTRLPPPTRPTPPTHREPGEAGGHGRPLTQSGASSATREVLEEARRRRFVGPGPVEAHVVHAWPLVAELPPEARVVDLGSGGGVPGLVLAAALPR